MYTSRTALILFIILIIGTILQLIGLFSIGWNIQTDKNTHISTYQGLWFYKTCDAQGSCKTRSYYDDYEDNHDSLRKLQYSYIVGSQVIALLSFIFCLLSTVLAFLIFRDHAHKLRFCMSITCLLLVSGSLIWTEIGSRSAANAAMVAMSHDNYSAEMKFPYSLFLSALGSSATIAVGLVNFVFLWRDNFGRSELFLLGAQNTD